MPILIRCFCLKQVPLFRMPKACTIFRFLSLCHLYTIICFHVFTWHVNACISYDILHGLWQIGQGLIPRIPFWLESKLKNCAWDTFVSREYCWKVQIRYFYNIHIKHGDHISDLEWSQKWLYGISSRPSVYWIWGLFVTSHILCFQQLSIHCCNISYIGFILLEEFKQDFCQWGHIFQVLAGVFFI